MNEISAVIVAKDNPIHIFETLQSIESLVKEIVIADIGISSSTLSKLKQNKKVKIVKIKKEIQYVELIREEIKKYAANEYVLFLDPDEILTESLVKLLLPIYKQYCYLRIPRKNIIFGKWIKHSRWWPDYQVRLFKKESVLWPKEIHKQPQVQGNGYIVEPLEEYALLHFNYESIDEFMQKMVRYAKSEAYELSSFSLSEALKKGLSEFISRYFADEGYKDGVHGLVLSFLQMLYYFLVYIYYWERRKFNDESQNIHKETLYFFKSGFQETSHWLIQKKLVSGLTHLKLKLHQSIAKRLP